MNLKKLNLTVLLVTILVLVPTIQIVYASSLSTFYLSGGIYPQADYTIWKEGSYYYAKNAYGYQPSWSGSTNATDVIQNAVNNGKTTFLKAGIYDFNDVRVFVPSNHTIFGESKSKTIIRLKQTTETGVAFCNLNYMDYDPAQDEYITIENLRIDASFSTQPTIPIYLRGVNYAIVRNCVIEKFNGTNVAGISLSYSNGSIIENNIVKHGGWGGSTTCEGIYICHTSYSIIKGNYIYNMSREGIYNGEESHHVVIEGNVINCTGGEGINLKNLDSHITVSGNTLSNCQTGIYAIDEASGLVEFVSITGNTIFNCTNGIILRYAEHFSVSGNTIDTVTDRGIAISDSGNSTIVGNTIDNCAYGIRETDASDYNIILGCVTRECTTVGIEIVGSNTKVNHCWNGTSWIE